ncbi:MAG: hypothetical protein HOP11_08640 [Saprospiraceae bacterium]|nr:hypothetical protein [Saprospiraceae bacterium]
MKINLFPALILLFCLFEPCLELSANSPSALIQKPELQTIIHQKVENQRSLIVSRHDVIDGLQKKLKESKLDSKSEKVILNQIKANQKIVKSFEDKMQCYLLAQTLTNQIQYLPNYKESKETKRILSLILKIDRNKIHYKEAKKDYSSLFNQGMLVNYIPEYDCKLEVTQDGKVKANQFAQLFSFTPAELEKHFVEQEFLETYCRFLKSGKKYFLELKFEFGTPKAIQLYGIIEETSPLKLTFIDEDYIYLQNAVTAPPEQQIKTGKTVYKMQCNISRSDFKKLSKKDVDKLTVLWPTGSETYEMMKLHVFQNLSKCIQIKN